MNGLLTFFFTLILIGCGQTQNNVEGQWKTIEIGDYLFDFPSDFELVTKSGIDSYIGSIIGDSMSFKFDFGYYANDFGQTPQEYLDNGPWRENLSHRFFKVGISYDQTNMPKIDVIDIRPANNQDSAIGKVCDFIAKCNYDKTEFEYAIFIPNEIKQTNFEIDTIANMYRKIVWPKGEKKGKTGIYLKDLNGLNKSMNSYIAVSLVATDLSSRQQEIALKIVKTGRLKNRNKSKTSR